MDNQHRKISGYRDLTEHEIDLINKVKALGAGINAVVNDVERYLALQEAAAPRVDAELRAKSIHDTGTEGADSPEQRRLWTAEPARWCQMARTDFQVGLMKLTRAVAQPGFF